MFICRTLFACLMVLIVVVSAHAQTSDFHMTLGAAINPDAPPVEMDMSWAREGDVTLPPGKTLRLFVLWGDFGREGQWLSKYLPVETRAGKGKALMFEDGRWQPLRPVGIRHGLEIAFGEAMANKLDGQIVGILFCTGSREELGALVAEAMARVPSNVVAVVQLRERADKVQIFDEGWPERSNNPDLLVWDMTPLIPVSRTDLDQSASMKEKGEAMAVYVLNKLKSRKDK